MSVSMSRSEGVKVLALASDQSCPPLCQLLGALCCSLGLCSKDRLLVPHRPGAQTALGALWILTGLLHLGLGLILFNTSGAPVFILRISYCPVWLGVLFPLFGLCSILSEKHPRPLLVLLTGILNLAGVVMSIPVLVWYCTSISYSGFWSFCRRDHWWYFLTSTTESPEQQGLLERCEEAQDLLRALTTTLRCGLIVVASVDLAVALSGLIISFKTLKDGCEGNNAQQKENKE